VRVLELHVFSTDFVHSFSKQILELLVVFEDFENVDHVIVAPDSSYETDLQA
jgi:hypothetical protein